MTHKPKRLLQVAAILLFISGQGARAIAQSHPNDDIPKIVLSGVEAYKAEGPEAALAAWIKGSPIEGSKDAMSQANILHQVQDFYGSFKGVDLIRARNLTPNVRVLYLSLNYEKGPVFAKFTLYQNAQGWILTNFLFNTKEEAVLPASL